MLRVRSAASYTLRLYATNNRLRIISTSVPNLLSSIYQWSAAEHCRSLSSSSYSSSSSSSSTHKHSKRNRHALFMTHQFRQHGFKLANINPLRADGFMADPHVIRDSVPRSMWPLVDALSHYRTNQPHRATVFQLNKDTFHWDQSVLLHDDDAHALESCIRHYCSGIGFEFEHCQAEAEREFFASIAESDRGHNNDGFDTTMDSAHAWTYEQLVRAEKFEQIMGERYSTSIRFGIEGLESAIPALNAIFQGFAHWDHTHNDNDNMGQSNSIVPRPRIILGPSHRGRLNIRTNVIQYPLMELLKRSDANEGPSYDEVANGCSRDVVFSEPNNEGTREKCVHVSMLPIVGHLEAMDASIAGKARAHIMMDYGLVPPKPRNGDEDDEDSQQARHRLWQAMGSVLPITTHGDSAFCGQGMVQEMLQLGTCEQYDYGGAIRIIMNNQIGFTTEATAIRTARHQMCQVSDIARSVGAPIMHVNTLLPHDAVRAARIALAYRQRFHKDVIINLWGWRKHGHNEIDEPHMTNVKMYEEIDKLDVHFVSSTFREYVESIDSNFQQKADEIQCRIEKEFADVKAQLRSKRAPSTSVTRKSSNVQDEEEKGEDLTRKMESCTDKWRRLEPTLSQTPVDEELFSKATESLTTIPDNFNLHPTVKRVIDARAVALRDIDGGRIDWATAELLALATLGHEGVRCRLSGEDVERGTFSQRHAVWNDAHDGRKYHPLPSLVEVCMSPLSELGVIGFEFGWSTADPDSLVVWEAQFGDFVNTAEAIIDTIISACGEKWDMQSGLVLLLPHGLDGMGAEHSSSHVERWLQMFSSSCSPDKGHTIKDKYEACNFIVSYPTEPSNYFHLLRRQLTWTFRRPMFILSPKRTLRAAAARSPISNFIVGGTQSSFLSVLDDPVTTTHPEKVHGAILCSGQIYYDLCQLRPNSIPDSIAIIRLEELAPFPNSELSTIFERYSRLGAIAWAQEEPENDGPWAFVFRNIKEKAVVPTIAEMPLTCFSRPEAAAPATTNKQKHHESRKDLFERISDWCKQL